MGKIVDGVELLRMIRDEELRDGTKINLYLYEHQIGEYYLRDKNIFNKDDNDLIDKEHFLDIFINDAHKFEILSEEDEEIDIDSIEEVKHIYIYGLPPNVESVDDRVTMNEEKINELIKAVKQLNKKLEEK